MAARLRGDLVLLDEAIDVSLRGAPLGPASLQANSRLLTQTGAARDYPRGSTIDATGRYMLT